jgi:hypothetical protein
MHTLQPMQIQSERDAKAYGVFSPLHAKDCMQQRRLLVQTQRDILPYVISALLVTSSAWKATAPVNHKLNRPLSPQRRQKKSLSLNANANCALKSGGICIHRRHTRCVLPLIGTPMQIRFYPTAAQIISTQAREI